MLVTTEKDCVRLPEDDGIRRGRAEASRPRPSPIAVEFEDEGSAVKTRCSATALAYIACGLSGSRGSA